MPMPVMQVRIMGVFVAERGVAVPVCMRLGDGAVMVVSVMIVVAVEMIVLEGIMHVIMLVALRQMQPKAEAH